MNRLLSRKHGGVLIVVLVLILIGAMLTMGWMAVMGSEVQYVEQQSAAIKRRIATENVTGMARQYILSSVLTRDGAPEASADVGDGWGSIQFAAATGAPLTTFQKAAGYNHFNPGGGEGYTSDYTVSFTVDGEETSRLLQAKSHPALLDGSPVILGSGADLVAGSVSSAGETVIRNPLGTFSLASNSFTLTSLPTGDLIGLGGTEIVPTNFPFVPLTGSENGGVASYDGFLNVVANSSGVNSLAVVAFDSAPNGVQTVYGSSVLDADGVSCDGVGNVEIDLLEPALGNVLILGGVTHLTLVGQTSAADEISASNAAAILILVSQTDPPTDLVQVDLQNANLRKVVFAIKSVSGQENVINFQDSGVGAWRTAFILENSPVKFLLSGGSQSIVGGILTDRHVVVEGGSLIMNLESDPKLLDRLMAREGWVEAYTP